MSRIHVIGAGLSGLSAALSLSAAGRSVTVYEAGPVAGGRCRSYFDRDLQTTIDNGNHLLLSGNKAAWAYIQEIGAEDRCTIAKKAMFPFVDLKSDLRWVLRPNNGRIPWWILFPKRGVPNAKLKDYLALADLRKVPEGVTVAESMRRGWLYWRLIEPLSVAALNTPSGDASAHLLGAVIAETLLKGGRACIPVKPKESLSHLLIDPAVDMLRSRGVDVRFNCRVAELTLDGGRVVALRGPDGPIPVGPQDTVVLAVPSWVAADLLPGLVVPNEYQAIVNVHFRATAEVASPIDEVGFVGMMGGTAEWVFVKPGYLSVTISAANALVETPAEDLARRCWPNVTAGLGLDRNAAYRMPPYRVVKEKRATHAATAHQETRRPGPRTDFASNVAIAGDWTKTGLPATIEGAIRSGRSAAEILLSS